jgi:dTDP-4-dehydrorhamnose reductase
MRILLVGANGQVGHELRRSLAPLGEVIATTRTGLLEGGVACEPLDLGSNEAIEPLVERIAPDLIVNAAAYTAVDRAEAEPELAMRVNRDAPAELARACKRHEIRLVHYSTDYVFDGAATQPYAEDAPTSPLGVYGASKLAGEEAIRTSGAEHLILRTAWVYGLYGHNFLRTMLRLGAERDTLRVVADQIGSPTPAWLIADVTARLVRSRPDIATLNVVADGCTSWHGFAEAIFEEACQRNLLPKAPRVDAISTAEYPTPTARPAYSVLETTRLIAAMGAPVPNWRDALKQTFSRAAPPLR